MAKLDICTCLVDLNEYTTIARGELNPMNYAEVELMRFMLGDRAIRDLKVLRTEEATNQDVLDGLRVRYSARQVGEAFPGTRPRLPMEAPSDVPRLDAPEEDTRVSAAALKKRAQRAKAKAEETEEEPITEDDLADVFETAEES